MMRLDKVRSARFSHSLIWAQSHLLAYAIILLKKKEAGFRFFHGRRQLKKERPLQAFFEGAKKEIVSVGGTLRFIIDSQPEMRSAIDRNVRIKLVLLPPDSSYVRALAEAQDISKKDVNSEVTRALEVACDFKRDLPDGKKGYLEIWLSNLLPLYSISIRDGGRDEKDGMIRIEPFIYKQSGIDNRPSFEISEKDRPAEFRKYWEGYLYLMNEDGKNEEGKPTQYNCPPRKA